MKIKRKICIVTGSRADWGLLRNLARLVKDDEELNLKIVACGMHLEPKFGLTHQQITAAGFKIDGFISMNLISDRDSEIAASCGKGQAKFAEVFNRLNPDIVVVLGDRFETLAAASAALLCRIPVAHIHGGEITKGAYDDAIRHAVTKLSYLHFTSHEAYRERIIRMGEHPKRVFTVGAPGLDNLKSLKLLTSAQLTGDLGICPGPDTALVTFHPVTWEKNSAKKQVKEVISALDASDYHLIFTMPNADPENEVIFRAIDNYVKKNIHRSRVFISLGRLRYFSLMKHSGLMVGNSSSGIIEAASFRLPVINVGERQAGRVKSDNVIDTLCQRKNILKAIEKVSSLSFRKKIKRLKNPFGVGRASLRIKNILKKADISNLAKEFYD